MIAAWQYPGGSQADVHAKGFSWIHNYWCNLLNENAINGEPNPARPIAITAMIFLAISLISFWCSFPKQAGLNQRMILTTAVSGILAMASGFFLFTSYHDMAINMSGLMGLIALTGTMVGIWKIKLKIFFIAGIFNILLMILNNLLYYGNGLAWLPLVQKITFASFLVWIAALNIRMFNKLRSVNQVI